MFGGSFNPVHLGHLLVADEIAEILNLDRVLFVPAASPPHKPAAELAPARHRFEMTRLAVAEHPRFEVSDVELRRVARFARHLLEPRLVSIEPADDRDVHDTPLFLLLKP